MSESVTLPPQAASVGAGRRFVLERATTWGLAELADTAVLLTSELLTNSVLHARTDIELSIDRLPDGSLEICVRDASDVSPRRRRHSPDGTTGRGIELLDRLAASWEVTTQGTGKCVRFVVAAGVDPWAAFTDDSFADVDL